MQLNSLRKLWSDFRCRSSSILEDIQLPKLKLRYQHNHVVLMYDSSQSTWHSHLCGPASLVSNIHAP